MITPEARLDRTFQALSDSTRRSILMRVRDTDKTVTEIAEQYDMSIPAITKHLNILEQAGLIVRKKSGRHRLCRAEPESLSEATAWLDFYQQFWDQGLEHLKQFVEQTKTK